MLAGVAACKMLDADMGGPWVKEAEPYQLTPKTEWVTPVAVLRTEGQVQAVEALMNEDGKSCRLAYAPKGVKPVAILDFGKGSVGGYAVFTVTATSGRPVVRLAYANHPDGITETGDFTRETSARYLGKDVDLPVLPGNVNRHETYTIPRTGRYIAPLLQGQARYVRVQLDTPGTSVEIDAVAMVNSEVYDRRPADGAFLCSDERLNKLWAISTWTLQIASFPNHDAWKTVDGWLLPRKLEQGDDVGLSQSTSEWGDMTVETTFELRVNPHHVSAAGVAFRAKDKKNAYLVEVALDGTFRLLCRQDGKDSVLSERRLAAPFTDGTRYRLAIEARGQTLTTRLDGVVIDETRNDAFASGRVGFYTPKEKWPIFDNIRVADSKGRTLLWDDFSGDLSKWQFTRTLSFVADGAKRDRLVWSGDLYFAQRSAYYAFARPTYLRDSLKMLAFNQTPEGYLHASPYPERSVPPPSGDYGPFPSDEFAAWLIPVAWDHLLYTDDVVTLRELWPAITRLLGYLDSHRGENGLFVPRPETSKHAGNLNPGDVRTRAYMNILLWGTYRDAARIADRLGLKKEREVALQKAEAVKQALYGLLWDEAAGSFKEALESPRFGPEANALALSMGLVTHEQALRIAPQFKKIGHGKFQSLASRGKFEYGFGQSGLQALLDHNWLKLLDESWKGAWTTTECMGMITRGWGDESHPDTAIAGHFSAYVLGVRPTSPGYRHFLVKPQPTREVRWAKGLVPTPHGAIASSWELTDTALKLSLKVPGGTRATVVLPEGGAVTVNGAPGAIRDLKAGVYAIEVSGLPADAWADPTLATRAAESIQPYRVKASSSHEEGGWGRANLVASADDKAKLGYSSLPHPSAEADEWVEMDLGSETTLAKLVIVPRAGGAGFPCDFTVQAAKQSGLYETVATYKGCPVPASAGLVVDLYTVIGYPVARYVRIAATRLGDPAVDEPGAFRLQLARVRVVTP
jgi:alpha-L-rhamnosidase